MGVSQLQILNLAAVNRKLAKVAVQCVSVVARGSVLMLRLVGAQPLIPGSSHGKVLEGNSHRCRNSGNCWLCVYGLKYSFPGRLGSLLSASGSEKLRDHRTSNHVQILEHRSPKARLKGSVGEPSRKMPQPPRHPLASERCPRSFNSSTLKAYRCIILGF